MLRLMIVDDELWVCALLRQIIDWHALGYELVAEAHEGYEALRVIERYQPDVVLTDIRIPGLDGIAMVETARQQGFETEFIIISGYEDFEYAKKAIQVGVLDYILKPIEGEYLEELMRKTHEVVTQKRSRESETVRIKQLLDKSVNRLRDMFLLDVLHGERTDLEDAGLPQLNQEFGLGFQEGCFRVVLWKLEQGAQPLDQGLTKQVSPVFRRVLEERIAPLCCEACALWASNNRLVWVVNYTETTEATFAEAMVVAFDQLRGEISTESGLELSAALGRSVSSFHALADSYENASHALAARMFWGTGRLLELRDAPAVENGKKRLSLNQEMKLLNLFDAGDRDGLQAFLETLLSALPAQPEQAWQAYALARDIAGALYQHVREHAPELLEHLLDEVACVGALDDARNLETLIGALMQLAHRAWDAREQLSANQGNKIVDRVKAYITQHYRENISLNEAAAAVYVNASYLSDLFRRETGVVFTQYLTEYRMELAKELLTDMRYRIIDVADLVGYQDVNYFSRQFKKVVGISAASYRRLHL